MEKNRIILLKRHLTIRSKDQKWSQNLKQKMDQKYTKNGFKLDQKLDLKWS